MASALGLRDCGRPPAVPGRGGGRGGQSQPRGRCGPKVQGQPQARPRARWRAGVKNQTTAPASATGSTPPPPSKACARPPPHPQPRRQHSGNGSEIHQGLGPPFSRERWEGKRVGWATEMSPMSEREGRDRRLPPGLAPAAEAAVAARLSLPRSLPYLPRPVLLFPSEVAAGSLLASSV
ncbi:unnamed protein product [Rangifer tarandus platyrhynchus]|uniref:Uncharacterized protein n=1 Tax=Rangifer tarandus platyrhynchus TaxID=3082113 RepID=A0ABN8Y2R3_RANTA|nr:unnamed protein product [Rangifer tarandus platyrhynchus]